MQVGILGRLLLWFCVLRSMRLGSVGSVITGKLGSCELAASVGLILRIVCFGCLIWVQFGQLNPSKYGFCRACRFLCALTIVARFCGLFGILSWVHVSSLILCGLVVYC